MKLDNAIRDFLDNTIWIAYSGGLDSQVLLALCHAQGMKVRALHVHHGLNPLADQWAEHCRRYCQMNNIPYYQKNLSLKVEPGESLENVARKARYQVFREHVQAGDVILTAHHQDDQAETFLLQLLRGAGPKGLASMPKKKKLGQGWLVRPLLDFSRQDLLQYAQAQRLSWIDDDSNSNLKFARNFIRHEVLPLLCSRWQSAKETITRSANHCAEAQVLLEEFAAEACLDIRGTHPDTLSVTALLALPLERQRLVLRSWIYSSGFALPSEIKLNEILVHVLKAGVDRNPQVTWEETEVRRYKDNLYIQTPLALHNVNDFYDWDLSKDLHLKNIGHLSASESLGSGLRQTIKQLTVRFRQGGEIAHLPKRKHHELKKLFQEWNVLPWQRDRIPLLFDQDKLIAAVGYFIDPNYQAQENEKGWKIVLSSSPES